MLDAKSNNKKLFFALAGVLSFGLIVASVWFVFGSGFTDTVNRGTVMVVGYQGGLCSDGECSVEYKLYENGVFEGHKKVSNEELAVLKQVIDKTYFLEYSFDSNAFCQSYADGQDLVLTFPGRYEDQSFRPCSLAIPSDDTSIQYIKDFITNHSKD